MIHDLQSVVCIMILRRGCCSNWTRFFKFNWARFIVDWLQSRTQKLFDCIEIAAFHWVNWFIRFFFHLEIVYKISISFFFFRSAYVEGASKTQVKQNILFAIGNTWKKNIIDWIFVIFCSMDVARWCSWLIYFRCPKSVCCAMLRNISKKRS